MIITDPSIHDAACDLIDQVYPIFQGGGGYIGADSLAKAIGGIVPGDDFQNALSKYGPITLTKNTFTVIGGPLTIKTEGIKATFPARMEGVYSATADSFTLSFYRGKQIEVGFFISTDIVEITVTRKTVSIKCSNSLFNTTIQHG